jgi:hypothetical protein
MMSDPPHPKSIPLSFLNDIGKLIIKMIGFFLSLSLSLFFLFFFVCCFLSLFFSFFSFSFFSFSFSFLFSLFILPFQNPLNRPACPEMLFLPSVRQSVRVYVVELWVATAEEREEVMKKKKEKAE